MVLMILLKNSLSLRSFRITSVQIFTTFNLFLIMGSSISTYLRLASHPPQNPFSNAKDCIATKQNFNIFNQFCKEYCLNYS
ncbi:hypothetical protein DERF_006546 [Dermatophagoides farinae]|uniref:Uncharacterized protein n=1 Tax=Dermatophagoides farinae TaxID=6954 RepID=A0A922IBU3_DERFA|nr:hypothetical protein DERF_006546 [Dermatophagoides farinae]